MENHNRKSIRLRGFDYSKNGYYFVTIDVQDKLKLFWDENGKLNLAGEMVKAKILEIPEFYPGIGIDEFVIMPDHVHLIIEIFNNDVGADPRICPISNNLANDVGADPRICPKNENISGTGRTQGSARTFGRMNTLAEVVQKFKMLTTKKYIDGVKMDNWPRFRNKLWQRDYYERIIRNEIELIRIKKYIKENPNK